MPALPYDEVAQLDEVMKWRDGWRSLGDRNLPRGTFVRLG